MAPIRYRFVSMNCAWFWRLRLGGQPTFGLGGGGEKLTWGLLMTPSDIEAVAEAK